MNFIKRFDDFIDFHVMGRGFVFELKDLDVDRAAAIQGWTVACNALRNKDYFMVVLDELTYVMNYGFVDEELVIQTLLDRRPDLHVVITGRDASSSLIEIADIVTDMQMIKHPFQKGILGQKGIEF